MMQEAAIAARCGCKADRGVSCLCFPCQEQASHACHVIALSACLINLVQLSAAEPKGSLSSAPCLQTLAIIWSMCSTPLLGQGRAGSSALRLGAHSRVYVVHDLHSRQRLPSTPPELTLNQDGQSWHSHCQVTSCSAGSRSRCWAAAARAAARRSPTAPLRARAGAARGTPPTGFLAC